MSHDLTPKTVNDINNTLSFIRWIGTSIGGLFIALIPIYVKSIFGARKQIAADVDEKLKKHNEDRNKILSDFKQEVNTKLDEVKSLITNSHAEVYQHIMDTTVSLTEKYEELDKQREANEKEMIKLMYELRNQIQRCNNTHQPWDGRERRGRESD